ncbi:MAG: hypothetical protein GJ676_19475 [Rhodobacteraceae bacterium]|nr:hypothetical protein [Paracoccaceae bacterium]
MSKDQLKTLGTVTEALYLREHAKIADLLKREALIRSNLNRLDKQNRESTQSHDPALLSQIVGVDLRWQVWHNRAREQLNMELAQVTALKLEAMDRVRVAFGRRHAISKLAEARQADDRRAHQNHQLGRLLDLD